MTDMTKRRDEQAEQSVNRNMLELHEADARVRHYKLGYDDGQAEMQAHVDEKDIEIKRLRNAHSILVAVNKELSEERDALKAQVDNIRTHLVLECKNHNETFIEREVLKAQLEIAVKALDVIERAYPLGGNRMAHQDYALKVLGQIQKMRGCK